MNFLKLKWAGLSAQAQADMFHSRDGSRATAVDTGSRVPAAPQRPRSTAVAQRRH